MALLPSWVLDVGLVLVILGAFFGVYPALTEEKDRGERFRACDASVTPLMLAWKRWFTDRNLYAAAFVLVTVGTVLMSVNQLV